MVNSLTNILWKNADSAVKIVGATLSTADYYVIFAGGSMLLGILPWYSWACLFFAIPILLIDVWIIVAMAGGFYTVFLVPFPILHMLTVPIGFLLAVFGEAFLIPLAIISPFTFGGGLIAWIIGEL